ncbi:MAG: hypothetical protein H0T78_11060, partial [Longispora sp.]|nr:hypothetical protein [Longispora sp. (in: high G+C Gram-positive bacteria)]
YTAFTTTLDTAEATYSAAEEAYDASAEIYEYEGATTEAIDLEVMEDLRKRVAKVGAEETARLELLSPLDDDTRQRIQDTAAASLDALEHRHTTFAALLEVYQTQGARIADAQRAFHDTTTALVPTD